MKALSIQTRIEVAYAICLALVAGYVDAYGLLALRTFVSFMSGNSTYAGLRTGQGHYHAALLYAVSILFFLVGTSVGNLVTYSKFRYSHRVIFGLIGVLLLAVVFYSVRGRGIPSPE